MWHVVGRRFPVSADHPYGLDRKSAALVAKAEAQADEAAKSPAGAVVSLRRPDSPCVTPSALCSRIYGRAA